MKINKLAIGLLIATIVSGCYLFRQIAVTNKKTNQIVIGIASGYAPFVSVNQAGDYEGFDIDFAKLLAKELNQELVFRDLGSMTSLFTALNQGQIDLVAWGMSITQERLKNMAMVHYYGQDAVSYPLIFWQEIPAGVAKLDDLANFTVCFEPNSSQQAVLDQYDLIHKLPVEKIDDALLNIQYGKAIAALVEPVIAQKFMAKYPQIKILNVPLTLDLQEHGIGLVIRPDRLDLIRQVQKAVQVLKTSTQIDDLAQKWGLVQ